MRTPCAISFTSFWSMKGFTYSEKGIFESQRFLAMMRSKHSTIKAVISGRSFTSGMPRSKSARLFSRSCGKFNPCDTSCAFALNTNALVATSISWLLVLLQLLLLQQRVPRGDAAQRYRTEGRAARALGSARAERPYPAGGEQEGTEGEAGQQPAPRGHRGHGDFRVSCQSHGILAAWLYLVELARTASFTM